MKVQVLPNYVVIYKSAGSTALSKTRDRLYDKPNTTFKTGSRASYRSSWSLSVLSQRLIRKSVIQLFTLVDGRTVFTKTGKVINNFKAAFLTLTLPSKQVHTDKEIKLMLQKFLDWLYSLGLRNYVWKAELQKNGNIHFHIVLDQFYDVQGLQEKWNEILSHYGYIEAFSNKFSSMSLFQYAQSRSMEVEKCVSAYAKGCACGWSNPPTVDSKVITTNKGLSYYLSKYLAKPADKNENEAPADDRAQQFGKIWSRSQSLSGIVFSGTHYSDIYTVIDPLIKSEYVKAIYDPFYSLYLFNLEDLPDNLYNIVLKSNFDRAKQSGYFNNT